MTTAPDVVTSYTEHVLRVVAHLVRLEARTGQPFRWRSNRSRCCFLETTDETIDYFENHLYSGPAAERLATLADIPVSDALGALRRHLGIVFDICHQAVGFEDIPVSLQNAGRRRRSHLEASGSRGDAHAGGDSARRSSALQRSPNTVYLSQTVERATGRSRASSTSKTAFAA